MKHECRLFGNTTSVIVRGTHPTFLWIRDQPTYLGSGGKLSQTTTQPKWDSCFEEDRFTCYPVQKFTCKDSQKW